MKLVNMRKIQIISSALVIGALATVGVVFAAEKVSPEVSEGGKLALSGKYDEAMSRLNAAIKVDPTSSTAYLKRAATLAKMHKYGDALNDCSKSIKLDSKNPRAFALRGLMYKQLGKYKKEVADMRTARELLKGAGK